VISPAEHAFCVLVRRLAPAEPESGQEPLARLDQRVRFVADVGYANPGREVVRVTRRQGRFEVSVNRFVLAGLFGPLPEPFQELAARRAAAGRGATASFLDLFNHRLNLLRFWVHARHSAELAGHRLERTPLAELIVGLVEGWLVDVQAAPSPSGEPTLGTVLRFAALLRHPEPSIAVVERVLREALDYELDLRPFAGGWIPRRERTFMRLGVDNSALGRSSVLGKRVWDQGKGLELSVKCPTDEAFRALLPGGGAHARLVDLVRWLTRRRFDVHVVCLPPSGDGTALDGNSARLSYTARLTSGVRVATPSGIVHFTIFAEETAEDEPQAA
jgi:type VI secretion system protein ImpH